MALCPRKSRATPRTVMCRAEEQSGNSLVDWLSIRSGSRFNLLSLLSLQVIGSLDRLRIISSLLVLLRARVLARDKHAWGLSNRKAHSYRFFVAADVRAEKDSHLPVPDGSFIFRRCCYRGARRVTVKIDSLLHSTSKRRHTLTGCEDATSVRPIVI